MANPGSTSPGMFSRLSWLALLLAACGAQAQSCPSRGELDEIYCDANQDMLADRPTVSVNPDKIVLAMAAIEDANTARRTYAPLLDYLGSCLKKEVELFPPVREGAVLEGQRSGAIHIGHYATGGMLYAVNFAGAIPFAGKGEESRGHADSYTLKLLVRADSPAKKASDLKGKRVAHTRPPTPATWRRARCFQHSASSPTSTTRWSSRAAMTCPSPGSSSVSMRLQRWPPM